MRYFKLLILIVLFYSASLSDSRAQLEFHSFGIDIAQSMNAISVGYQNFESLGMGTNFIQKGQPELSWFHGFVGVSVIAGLHDLTLMGRLSYDDRSGMIKDEFIPGSLSMFPGISYCTMECALMIQPWKSIQVYGGPSLSLLIRNSVGSIGTMIRTDDLSGMNSPVPGIFGGIQTNIPIKLDDFPLPLTLSPFAETSLLFNQRTGEFPENQDGFDNIWSTLSLRMGIRLSLSTKNHIPIVDTNPAFTLEVPEELTGMRTMKEYVPLLHSLTVPELEWILHDLTNAPQSHSISGFSPCTEGDVFFAEISQSEQRVCHQKRLFYHLAHHIKKNKDLLKFTICSKRNNEIQILLKKCLQFQLKIDSSLMHIASCDKQHIHLETAEWQFVNTDQLWVSNEFKSVSPIENIMHCTVLPNRAFSEFTIHIQGPKNHDTIIGPVTASTFYMDGSTLLKEDFGTGKYTWSILHKDENGKEIEHNQPFMVRMSQDNNMSGISVLYPNSWDESIIRSQLHRDLEIHLQNHDEVFIVNDDSHNKEHSVNGMLIQSYIEKYAFDKGIQLKQPAKIITKGNGLRLYDHTWSWGNIYEKGIRVEIVH